MAKSNLLEEMLGELGQKVDQLIDEMKNDKEEFSADFQEKMNELKDKVNQAAEDSKGFGSKAKERWENAKPHFDEAGREIGQALKRIVGK